MSAIREFADLRPALGFSMIMADPPWQFNLRSSKGEAKSAQSHYGCLDLDDLCALPVEIIAAEDAVLWLWATNPMLREAITVMGSWGFEYKTAGTWVKRTKHGKDHFGTGYVLRSANEPFLIGTRGTPKGERSVRSTVPSYSDGPPSEIFEDWARTSITIEAVAREHSRKPDEAFKAAEALMPDAQRIELFSRQFRPGWACWGNEVGKFDG